MPGQVKSVYPLIASAGTVAAPGIGTEPDTGFYPISANLMGVAANGARVAAFGVNGLLIGPSTSNYANYGLVLEDTKAAATYAASIQNFSTTGIAALEVYNDNAAASILMKAFGSAHASASEVALVCSSTVGSAVLELKGATAAGGQIQWFRNGVKEWTLYSVGGNPLYLRDGVNSRMQVTYTPGASAAASKAYFDCAVDSVAQYQVAGTKVIGAQGAAVADATDAASTMARLNDLLGRLRTHGIIAT